MDQNTELLLLEEFWIYTMVYVCLVLVITNKGECHKLQT